MRASHNRQFAWIAPLAALLLSAASPAPAAATDVPAVERVLAELIGEALQSNLGLAAQQASVAERQAALDAARARFLPSIDLSLRYSRADGGREIEFPVGDLLNPVYSSLNGLLGAAGQPAPFTPIDNASFRFLREREQDSVLRLLQPLYDPRLPAARDGAAHQYAAATYGLENYRQRLVRDLRQGYYRWLAARAAIGILTATGELAKENRRVNDSLYRNGKVTRDLVLRAEADELEVEQQLIRARAAETLARRYVNLLCNAPLERELEAATVRDTDLPLLAGTIGRNAAGQVAAAPLTEAALAHRPDLRGLESGVAAASAAERVAAAAFKPQVALALDAGTQGMQWDYGDQDPYVMASVVVRFNLFRGGGDRAAMREARARSAGLAATRELAEQQVRIEVQQAVSDLEVAEASMDTASRRVAAAEGAFTIVAKKRDLGQVPPAEFLDARRSLAAARLNANLARYDTLAALAQVEYASGAEIQP